MPRAAAPSPRPVSGRDFALGLTFVVLAFAGLVRAFAPHTVDDAWITFRYSRQWAEGHGPYFNPGEHVEGYSNFLLMAVMAQVIRVAGADAALPVAKGIGLASSLLAIVGTGLLARRAAAGARWADVAGITAAALVACSTGFAYHAMSGLETALYACLLTWGVAGLASERDGPVMLGGLTLAAAVLARPEAPLVCAIACGVALAARARAERVRMPPGAASWRALWIATLLVVTAVLGQLAFRRWVYDGEWLPNTFYAKAGGSGDRIGYVSDALRAPFAGPLGLLLALAGWLLGGRAARVSIVPAIVGVVGGALPLVTGGDWMPAHRLVVPYVPLLAVTVSFGWARLLARARRGGTGLLSTLLLLSAPLSLALQWGDRSRLVDGAATQTAGVRTGHAALATWLRASTAPGDAIVLMDIGEVGYRCIEQRIVDVTGLTDRQIAKSPGTFMDKRFDLAYVWAQRPAAIVLTLFGRDAPGAPLHPFSPMEQRLALDPEFQREFIVASSDTTTDAIDRLRTSLGADALFAYATPGRRYVLAAYRRHG
jgi:hypothetical protein